MTNQVDDGFEELSEKEKEIALRILNELSETGVSEEYNNLLYADYAEIPVDIETFLRDRRYLGNGLTNEDGRFTVFPYWVETLKKIFPTNIDTAYNTVILTGGIGLGKSLVGVICVLYPMYRMLCLKDPYVHYGLQRIDHITFSFINITLDAARGVAWAKCQELLKLSPWFLEHGTLSKSNDPQWSPNGGIELVAGSMPRHILGRAVFGSFEDEVSFQQNQDLEKQKEKAQTLVSTVDARMQSRFMKGEKLPTVHIIASSKRTEQSFLETYIDMKKKNDSKTTLIIDEPQWVIRDDKLSKRSFYVAVGNKFLDSEVLPLSVSEQEMQIYRDKGFKLLEVPFGYYEQFIDDIDIALTDIAGISTTNSTSYISGVRWAKCRSEGLENPFTKEKIIVGNAPDDTAQYKDFFDISKIPEELRYKPIYIHLDMSLSGDSTGIAGVVIRGKRPHQEGVPESKELYYQLLFSVAVEAPKGHQVSFEKNRQFIYWLKDQGLNIKGVSSDTFQSADLGQQLLAHRIPFDIISVDRVQDRVCKPYLVFKNAIYEERIVVYNTKILTDEIIGLVRDGNGKIDHSPSGINSKDISDAVCGSLYNASQHAEEYAYDFGEDLETIDFVNAGADPSTEKEQYIVNLEDELKGYSLFSNLAKPGQEIGLDFGAGRSQPYTGSVAVDGMLIW